MNYIQKFLGDFWIDVWIESQMFVFRKYIGVQKNQDFANCGMRKGEFEKLVLRPNRYQIWIIVWVH